MVSPPSARHVARPISRPRSPRDRSGRQTLSAAPVGEGVQPAVGRGVGALAGRAEQRGCRGERAEPVQRLRRRGVVQVPRAVDLWRPVPVDELVGDVGQRGVLDHRRGVQHTAHRKPGGGGRGHQALRGVGFGDVAALHHDVGPGRADALDGLLRLRVGLRAGGQHDPAAARRGHPRGEEQPEATQAAGDDVGAVAAEDRACSGGTTTLLRPACGTARTSLPVCSAALITRIAVAASASG